MNTKPAASSSAAIPKSIRHFFVDEAGDPTIFGRRGKLLIGTEGCSRFFMLGMAEIENPPGVFEKVEELRKALLADPYFRGIPSMQLENKKTAICFHAKDDLPEVRREVFKLLPQLHLRVRIAVLSKEILVDALRQLLKVGMRAGFDENEMYDKLVQQLLHNQLHESEANAITFARRGKAARIEALADAITTAKKVFRKHHGQSADPPCQVVAFYPSECIGLQVIDYYLWAYQRMIERNEDRFFNLIQAQVDPVIGDPSADARTRSPAIAELRTLHLKSLDPRNPKKEKAP